MYDDKKKKENDNKGFGLYLNHEGVKFGYGLGNGVHVDNDGFHFWRIENMKKILIFIFAILILSACSKPDRIDHQDDKYIYVWQYDGDDSTLVKFSQPVIKELKVMGGHHKNHHIKVDFHNNGRYDCCVLPWCIDRCKTVAIAQDAEYKGTPIIGIFQEQFYPIHDFRFIKYKE